jgi:hypothetical protein
MPAGTAFMVFEACFGASASELPGDNEKTPAMAGASLVAVS